MRWRLAWRGRALGAVAVVAAASAGLGAPVAYAAPACGAGTFTVAALHGSGLPYYVDTSTSPTIMSQYVGYTITNGTGSSISNYELRVGSFSGGSLGVAANETNASTFSLAAGASTSVFLYLTASSASASTQSFTATIYNGPSGSAVCDKTDSFSGVADTIKASANKVNSVTASSGDVRVGDTFTLTVAGDTGTVGAGPDADPGVIQISPASRADWPANKLVLTGTSFVISADGDASASTYTNVLRRSSASGPDRAYTIVYTFRIAGTTSSTIALSPVQNIASGSNVKHTDTTTATYTALAPVVQVITNSTPAAATATAATSNASSATGTITTTDANGDALTYAKATDPTNGTATVSSGGSYTYTPTSGYTGSDSFTASACDSRSACGTVTVNVTVTANQTPTGSNVSVSTAYNTAKSGSAPATDADGDSLTYTKPSGPSNGTATVGSGGAYTYTPTSGFSGSDTFTVRACDPSSACANMTVTVTVAANQTPTGSNVSVSTRKNTAVSGSAPATDADGDSLTYTKPSGPSDGTATVESGGAYTYTPASGYTGTDTFTVRACDPSSACVDMTVTVTVSASATASSPAPALRAGYCLNGKFLDLEKGQPDRDSKYKGATPALVVAGKGETCDIVLAAAPAPAPAPPVAVVPPAVVTPPAPTPSAKGNDKKVATKPADKKATAKADDKKTEPKPTDKKDAAKADDKNATPKPTPVYTLQLVLPNRDVFHLPQETASITATVLRDGVAFDEAGILVTVTCPDGVGRQAEIKGQTGQTAASIGLEMSNATRRIVCTVAATASVVGQSLSEQGAVAFIHPLWLRQERSGSVSVWGRTGTVVTFWADGSAVARRTIGTSGRLSFSAPPDARSAWVTAPGDQHSHRIAV